MANDPEGMRVDLVLSDLPLIEELSKARGFEAARIAFLAPVVHSKAHVILRAKSEFNDWKDLASVPAEVSLGMDGGSSALHAVQMLGGQREYLGLPELHCEDFGGNVKCSREPADSDDPVADQAAKLAAEEIDTVFAFASE